MAYNWGAIEQQKEWSTEDQRQYALNKKKWDSSTDENEKSALNAANTAIRNKYGVGSDDYGSKDANDAFVFNSQVNPYISKADSVDFNIDDSGLKSAKNALTNFEYNPEEDAAYQSYREQAQREGASAAKSTLNELNSASMGRNSSYSAAATAQVQQAYAQKVSDKAAELAQQAYQKLLDRYNMEKAEYDSAYSRKNDEYNRYIARADQALNRWSTVEQLNQAQEQHDKNMVSMDLANQLSQKEVNWFDRNAQSAYDYQNENIRNVDANTAYTNKQTERYDDVVNSEIALNKANEAGVYSDINVNNAQAANYNAQAQNTQAETSAAAVKAITAKSFLTSKGLVDSNGNCKVIYGGEQIQMSASEVANGLATGSIIFNDAENLVYVGG